MIEKIIDKLEWFEFHNKNLTKEQYEKIREALFLLKAMKNDSTFDDFFVDK